MYFDNLIIIVSSWIPNVLYANCNILINIGITKLQLDFGYQNEITIIIELDLLFNHI